MPDNAAVAEDDFLDLEDYFRNVRYSPHVGQLQIHASSARHRIISAGRRFGKSVIGGKELGAEAIFTFYVKDQWRIRNQRREFWIVGPEYSDSEKEFRVLWNDLRRLDVPFDKPGSYNNPESGDLHISLWGGIFKCAGMSAKYPTTLVGEGLSGVVLAEAAKLKPSVWTKYIRPTLADFKGWSLATSTPEGKNWFYDHWKRGQNYPLNPNWQSWRMPSWVNPIVYPLGRYDPEIVEMQSEMTAEKFEQEIGASFTEFVGRVFKNFDEEIHVTNLKYDPTLPIYGAVDYGWTNPFVWLVIQVDAFDNVRILQEFRTQYQDIEDIGRNLQQLTLPSRTKQFFPDPASPGDTAILEKYLRCRHGGGTGGEVKNRIDLIRKWLKAMHGNMHPKLLIDRSCTELIREMNDYRYPETKAEALNMPELPMKKDDHGPEALGRFMIGYFGDIASGPTKLTTAKIG